MEFRILGPLEVVEDGRPVRLDRRLSRALLAYLLLHANEPVSSDRLIDELWGPGAPRTATASLQNYVSRLRKTLGPALIQLEPAGYVLRVDPERFDLSRFERLVEEAHAAPAKARAELLKAALSLWRGAPLEDLAFEEFAQAEIAHLAERRLAATEERIDADLELGRGAELVDELEELIAEHPLRERLRAQLMVALYRAGRQADALAAFRDARGMLQNELGLEPSEELRALERKILEQDPSLGAGGVDRPPTAESRRTVTVFFCDIVDSTRLATRLDPEAYRRLMSSYFDAVRSAVQAHGGTVEKFIGDAVMALFGVPELHEDDALRAVRAAVDVQAAVARVNKDIAREWDVELAIRIAVNTGEVVASGPGRDALVTGAAVNVASHLEKRAGAGEIVLGERTQLLLRDAVRADPVELGDDLRAWRLEEVITHAPTLVRHVDTPLVGRKKELRRLRTAFQRAQKEEHCIVATVVGEPGIGKTRLARELVASLGDEVRVLVGRCVSYGAGATYLPIAEIVRQAAPEASIAGIASLLAGEEDAEQVAERVAEVIGIAEGPAAPGEAFWAVRRLLEAVARERPVLVAFDDIHWAEPTLLDLVEYLGEWAAAPIMVICLARRDLLEARPGWGGPTSTGFVVELEPLPPEDADKLVEEIAGGPVAPDIRERIVDQAGGNPLFAEQLLALAAEAPDVSLDQAPPSVEALIASRLGRLDPRELDLLRRASVIGRSFLPEEVKDLGPLEQADLVALERRALVHPLQFGDGYVFHHVLLRDVVYRGVPKTERAELHEQVADNLDRRDGADELIGYHLEQAYRYRAELARVDDRARRLATAAGDRLGRAGIRAWKRADTPAAVNLLGRAVNLLPAGDAGRHVLLCELGLAFRMRGELDTAETALSEAVETSRAAKDRRVELRAQIELASVRALRFPERSRDVLDIALLAIPELKIYDDDRALGRAWLQIGLIRGGFYCQDAAWEEAATKAAVHYTRAGWSPSMCLGGVGTALYYGPRHVREALEMCAALLTEHSGDLASEASVTLWMGMLEAMLGRFDDGRAHVKRAIAIWDELGQIQAAETHRGMALGAIDVLANQPEDAETAFRDSCEACARLGEFSMLASRAAELADVLYTRERYEEAEEWAKTARANAAEFDLDAQATWRAVRAKLHAQKGELALGEGLIREAIQLLEPTDVLNDRANVLLDLAEVLRLADRADEAVDAVRGAYELFTQKGNIVSAERAQALLSETSIV